MLYGNKAQLVTLGLVALLICSHTVSAQEFTFDSSYSLVGKYDDNFQLSRSNKRTLTGYTQRTNLDLGARTETFSSSVQAILEFSRFDREEYDTDDQIIRATLDSRLERYSYGLNLDYKNDSIRVTEATDSGIIGTGRYEEKVINPYFTFNSSQNSFLRLNLRAQDSEYEDDRYTDYKFWSAEVTGIYLPTEKSQLAITALKRGIENDERPVVGTVSVLGNGQTVVQFAEKVNDVDGWYVSGEYDFTENLMMSVQVGKEKRIENYENIRDPNQICQQIDQSPFISSIGADLCNPLETDIKVDTADVSLTWDTETTKLILNYSESLQPSSTGNVTSQKNYVLSWSFRLTEQQTFAVEYDALDIEEDIASLSGVIIGNNDRNLNKFSLDYSYNFLEHWRFTANYRYRTREFIFVGSESETAVSNVIQIGISYLPQGYSW